MVEPIRAVDPRRRSVLLFVVAHFVIAALVNLVFFTADTFRPLASATGGLFTGSLFVNLLLIMALIWGVIGRLGGLRPYDVGLNLRKIPLAIAYTVMLWLAAQAIHFVLGFLYWGQVAPHPGWVDGGVNFVIGLLLAQLLGNALFEEIAYRGFLFPQMFLRLKDATDHPQTRLALAILISQILFALSHIPNRIYLGMSAVEIFFDLLMLLGWGVLYTLVYIRTDNLFIVVGIHALGNTPTTLFATAPLIDGGGGSLLIYTLAFLGLFALPYWRSRHTAQAQPSEINTPQQAFVYATHSHAYPHEYADDLAYETDDEYDGDYLEWASSDDHFDDTHFDDER